jgi:hypothetical protein
VAWQWVGKESSSAIITRALCSVIKTGKKKKKKTRAEIVFSLYTTYTTYIYINYI